VAPAANREAAALMSGARDPHPDRHRRPTGIRGAT
jgi:hypothetical protein